MKRESQACSAKLGRYKRQDIESKRMNKYFLARNAKDITVRATPVPLQIQIVEGPRSGIPRPTPLARATARIASGLDVNRIRGSSVMIVPVKR